MPSDRTDQPRKQAAYDPKTQRSWDYSSDPTPSIIGHALGDHSNVGVDTPTLGNYLRADGDSWESSALHLLDDTAPVLGGHLTLNGKSFLAGVSNITFNWDSASTEYVVLQNIGSGKCELLLTEDEDFAIRYNVSSDRTLHLTN